MWWCKRTIVAVVVMGGLLAPAGPAPGGQGGHAGVAPPGRHGFGPYGYGWYGPRHIGYGYGYVGFGFYGYPYGFYPYPYPYPYYDYPPIVPGGQVVVVPPPGAPPLTDNRCHIRVLVPPDATLWVGNEQANKTGPVREFVSPVVAAGQSYTYGLRAQWTKDGQVLEQARDITVQPNQLVIVHFGEAPRP
jgi:uncharacterized protein (TIGR03000 family)